MRRWIVFFFQAEDGIRDKLVTGVQTCALPISPAGISKLPPARRHARHLSPGQPDVLRHPAGRRLPESLRSLSDASEREARDSEWLRHWDELRLRRRRTPRPAAWTVLCWRNLFAPILVGRSRPQYCGAHADLLQELHRNQ